MPELRGRVETVEGTALAGGRIEAGWSSAKTDSRGHFLLLVERLGCTLDLEIFSTQGEPLGGYWTVELPDSEFVDLGVRIVPEPSEAFGRAPADPLLAES